MESQTKKHTHLVIQQTKENQEREATGFRWGLLLFFLLAFFVSSLSIFVLYIIRHHKQNKTNKHANVFLFCLRSLLRRPLLPSDQRLVRRCPFRCRPRLVLPPPGFEGGLSIRSEDVRASRIKRTEEGAEVWVSEGI